MNRELIEFKLKELKSESGTHSPSISTILSLIPELKIKIDACFLSNPYATDLFMEHLYDISSTEKLRFILEFYPPQNIDISKRISSVIGTNPENIFVGNGAIEIIQACMQRFAGNLIALPIPTFSSYYEFVNIGAEVKFYQLEERNNFELNLEDFSQFIDKIKADTAIIINPNNPVGNYLSKEQIELFLANNSHLKLIIIDESFLHFAYDDLNFNLIDNSNLIKDYPNLVLVKSMSKDFGIAGIRAGYGIMSSDRVSLLLTNGYLWNISGIANYFYDLYCDKDFLSKYELVRKKYIFETKLFLDKLKEIDKITIYPSKANFVLIKLPENVNSFDFTMELLIKNGIYLRDCSDKIGLNGNFIRVASRTFKDNQEILNAFQDYFGIKYKSL